MFPLKSKIRKVYATFFLVVFSFFTIGEFLVSVQPAQAQAPVTVVADVPKTTSDVTDKIQKALKIAFVNALNQMVGYFMKKVAYDTAVWVAAGGKGQSSLTFKKGFGSYLEDVAGQAAGQAIDSLGKGFGLDLCKIPDVKLDLALRIGMRFNYGAPAKPVCDWNTFKDNWSADAWKSKYGNAYGQLDTSKIFASSLSIDNTDLGVTIKTSEKIDRLVAAQTNGAKSDRTEGQGFNSVLGKINDFITTPASIVKKQAEDNSPSEQKKAAQAQVGATLASGLETSALSAATMFLSTLFGESLKNFKENGMLPGGICVGSSGLCADGNNGSTALNADGTGQSSGRAVAEAFFSKLLTTRLDTVVDYDIIGDLKSCEQKGLYNCRVDESLGLALTNARGGKPVTIAQAMKLGWLHKDWKVLPFKGQETINTNNSCYLSAYCESNVKVLRQLRIFPVGFELAAARSNPDHPSTLEEVVRGFYDCDYTKDSQGNITGINFDPDNHPFCHLVDPNWVVNLPETRCDAKGPSASLLAAGVPTRISECADVKTCIGHNSDGTCAGYGYCAREKNAWKFDATSCDKQFATCKSFTDSTGNQVAYLYRTLDTESCSQSTVGCGAYSLYQNDSGAWLPVQPSSTLTYQSTGIYLNKNVSSCSESAVGCSRFNALGGYNNAAYLKKAPDYLKCYDSDPSTAAIDWPKTFSDLSKLTDNPACNNYAQACIADEVGCEEYRLTDLPSAFPITGKFIPATLVTANDGSQQKQWNDECDGRCVGYDAYKEMPTALSAGKDITYLIPPSSYNPNAAATCSAIDVGCSSFTNMDTVQNGGERVENYIDSQLISCVKPSVNAGKSFYTYESSFENGVNSGYKLQQYTLVTDSAGAPSTTFSTDLAASQADLRCNADLYKVNQADADCRQFTDSQGNVYYKLLHNVVVVSDSCTTYRLNDGELAGANQDQCFGGGQFKDGYCYYSMLPGGASVGSLSSRTCSAQAVSCREYRGNNSNVLKSIVKEDFENTNYDIAQNNWNASGGNLVISNESTQQGGHSLNYIGTGTFTKNFQLETLSLNNSSVGLSYSLSFWVKGSAGSLLEVGGIDGLSEKSSSTMISPNNNWSNVKVNFTLNSKGESGLGQLYFKVTNGSSGVFVDNLQLTQVTDYLYLVKNSINVDPVCDSNQNDNLPGEALGCSAYTNSVKRTNIFLTNFSFLCRDGAVGCNAFSDTFNKLGTTDPVAYNVSINGNGGQTANVTVNGNKYSCQVEAGKTSCLVKISESVSAIKQALNTSNIGDSLFYVPSPSLDSNPVYLVANQSSQCGSVDLGCTYAGLETNNASGTMYVTTTIKVSPDQFETFADDSGQVHDGILCQKEAVGCGDYNGSYFKDPKVAGSKTCEFRSVFKDENGNNKSGWFVKGTNTACYPNFVKNGNFYDIWSFGNKDQYKGFVGECPVTQNTCTEFVDHGNNNSAYYFLDNGQLSDRDDSGDCSGQINRQAGCVLFDKTSDPNKIYDTAASYAYFDNLVLNKNSDILNDIKQKPVSTATNDANVILKVTPTHECAEWLQCASYHSVWDPSTGKWKDICDRFDRCNALPEVSTANDRVTNCSNFIGGINSSTNQIFTEEVYAKRKVGGSSSDYTGFSIVGMYSLEDLNQFNFGSGDAPDWRVAKGVSCPVGGTNCSGTSIYGCSENNKVCGNSTAQGWCINNNCAASPKGDIGSTNNVKNNSLTKRCRVYPDENSPFPFNTSTKPVDSSFSMVNKCGESGKEACECDYQKVDYGNGSLIKFLSYEKDQGSIPSSVCVGGKTAGASCDISSDATDQNGCVVNGGSCMAITNTDKYIGWKGICLEYDLSRTINGEQNQHPCLTWLPLNQLNGVNDINNQYPEAGFIVPQNGLNYCLSTNVFKQQRAFSGCYASKSSPNLGCSWGTDDCVSMAQQICGSIGWVPEKGECGGRAYPNGVTDDCADNYWPDRCAIKCAPPAGTDDNWYSNIIGGYNAKVGCEAFVSIDSGSTVFTDRISSGSNFQITPDSSHGAFSENINFTKNSPQGYFAGVLGPFVVSKSNGKNEVFSIHSCYEAIFGYKMAKSDGTCLNGQVSKDAASDQKSYLSYGPFEHSTKSCGNDSGCNINQNYQSAECIINTPSQCMIECTKDSDCPYSGTCDLNFEGHMFCSNASTLKNKSNPGLDSCSQDGIFGSCSASTSTGNGYGGFCLGTCNDASGSLSGKNCSKDAACYVNKCVDNVCFYPENTALLGSLSLVDRIRDSLKEFSQIFSRISLSSIKFFSTTTQKYELLSTYPNSSDLEEFLDTTANADKVTAPSVHPVGKCDSEGKCLEVIEQDGFSVNGKYDQDVLITSKPAVATIRFFGFADTDHMPIKKVSVDWDDGRGANGVPGMYRNQRGYREAPDGSYNPICNGSSFGQTSPTACDNHYFEFSNSYSCVPNQGANWKKAGDPICGSNPELANGCCVYYPKVQILDNWGWCNGSCFGESSAGGTGCYNGFKPSTSLKNECSDIASGSYTSFGGGNGVLSKKVIVAPTK